MALGGYPLRHIQTDDRRVNIALSVTAPGDLPACERAKALLLASTRAEKHFQTGERTELRACSEK